MKKILITSVLTLWFSMIFSQIVLESTYPHSGTYTKLANSGYKFFVMDVGANQCRIYNNHTLWKTINLSVPSNHYLYDIKFVTENLFTTDNSLCLVYIYYNYNSAGQYYTYTAKVIKENGTELLTIPGCQYFYVQTIPDGGAKMVAYSYNYSVSPVTIQTHVSDLPGHLLIIPGDSNCDGTVNLLDVVNTVNYIMGQNLVPFCSDNADANEDGLINIIDIVITVNIIMNTDSGTEPEKTF